MAISKMPPRRFWAYTGGKGDPRVEERYAAWEKRLEWLKENLPGLLGLGVVLFLTLVLLLLMFAEFRGYYLDQIQQLLQVR